MASRRDENYEQKRQAYFERTQGGGGVFPPTGQQQQQQQHQPTGFPPNSGGQQQPMGFPSDNGYQLQQPMSRYEQQQRHQQPVSPVSHHVQLPPARNTPTGHNQQILPSRGGRGGTESWGPFGPRTNRGGGGDPFRDTQGRIATNIRQGANAVKEGQREIPGLLNNMSRDEYRSLLEDQVEIERRNKEAQKAELEKTLWWEKAERRERASAERGGGDEIRSQPPPQQQQHQQQPQPQPQPQPQQQQLLQQPTFSAQPPRQQQAHPGSSGRGGGTEQRLDAMEVLVLENADLRRENKELRRVLAQYQERFGGM